MIQLVDDQLLGQILRGGRPPRPRARVFTTGCWYVRLCQAALRASERTGVLSRPFAALPSASQAKAIGALLELPDDIGMASLRELGPTIGRLRQTHDLNLLSIEALAAAIHLDAHVHLSAPAPRLEAALGIEGRPVTVVR